MEYIILAVYLVGYVVSFRMFMKREDNTWASVFMGLFFSIISWLCVITSLAFNSESTPPMWLTGKKEKL